jgi:hypothetical protein
MTPGTAVQDPSHPITGGVRPAPAPAPSRVRIPPLSSLLRDHLPGAAPHLVLSNPALPHWPAWVYGNSDQDRAVWQALAHHCRLQFIPSVDDLHYVKTSLNPDADENVRTGILWYQLHNRGTLDRKIGIAYQTAACGPSVQLVTPNLWFRVFSRVHPFLGHHSAASARYAATFTTEHDQPDFDQLTAVQRRHIIRFEKGIEAGVPLETIISQEAFSQVPQEWMRAQQIIPFQHQNGELHVFTTWLDNPSLKHLEGSTGLPIRAVYMEPEDERAFWARRDASASGDLSPD